MILALMAVAVDLLLPEQAYVLNIASKIAAGMFGSLFVAAMVIGRRFKFDPVLR